MALVMPPEQPWETNYQRQADEAFQIATSMSAAELRRLRPPLAQIRYLPPRFGYPSYVDRQWNIMQVFGITRTPRGQIPGVPAVRQDQRVDYSQYQGDQEGSDRNTNWEQIGFGGAS